MDVYHDSAHSCSKYFNLFVLTDVLVYVGDLTPLVTAAQAALPSSGGTIAFTVEHMDDDGGVVGYGLQRSGRFAHSARAILTLGSRLGFAMEVHRNVSTRVENGRPVPGMLFMWRTTADSGVSLL